MGARTAARTRGPALPGALRRSPRAKQKRIDKELSMLKFWYGKMQTGGKEGGRPFRCRLCALLDVLLVPVRFDSSEELRGFQEKILLDESGPCSLYRHFRGGWW